MKNLSVPQLLSPWIGGLAALATAHGMGAHGLAIWIITALCSAATSNGAHLLEFWIARRGLALPAPAIAATRKPPGGPAGPAAVLILCSLIAVPMLSSCASAPVTSTDTALYAAYGTYTAVENALAQAVTVGSISAARAAQLDATLEKAKAALDAARAAETAAPQTASAKLNEAIAALDAVEAVINSGVKKP